MAPAPASPPAAPGVAELPIAGQRAERGDAIRNRARIVDAARELLAEHGAAGLSMNSVAAAAGVGKGTIFRRFGDRDGLIGALLDDNTVTFQNAFLHGPPPLGPGAPAGERLESFVAELVRFQTTNIELLLAAEKGHFESASPPFSTFLIHVTALVAEIDPALDAAVVASLVLNAISPRAIRRLYRELGTSVQDLERSAVALLRGLTDWP